ncbi:vWA domain-containing protein [Actinoplanes sp. N902-109]|uniref:vWA domain-containing protein n=1 Tax=Actinoplanes sp. (strain N902-109) TaxID=649831 RepID=UPI0003293D78|nr:vWA domain-containing protein [Actinoplanes sp. N902-109]AGL18918.1 von Willebrand factor type A [Actinoplanes sp. N902-109]
MTATWTPGRQRLLVVPGPGLAGAGRLVVSRQDLAADAPGLLTVGSSGGQRLGVQLFSRPELPPGVLAIGADLAAEQGLDDPGTPWSLSVQPAAVPTRITLEPMTDGDLQEASRALLSAADLAGRVLFSDPAGSTWLTVAGMPFRLREATGPDGHELHGLLRIGRDTELMLYARSGRTGTDIVVLADCSGSMSIDDVPPVTGEDPYSWRSRQPGRASTMRRSEAQRQALLRLLDSRLSTAGRVSRIALVRFTTDCSVVFPAGSGMAEMSADSEPAVAADYRREVGRLLPASSNTDIGKALHFASELLHRHGVPGNEQLIVLISDGADWNPKGAESTGEAVAASTDPVSLMDELHQAAGIRLHAIGISDEAAFRRYWSREGNGAAPQPWMVPDHRLLADLVRVGGGDPSRIGGLDVLEKYFGGLGGGVTTRIGVPARAADPPPVQPDLAGRAHRELGIDPARRADFARQAEELREVYAAGLAAAGSHAHLMVLRPQRHVDQLAGLGAVAQSGTELKGWIGTAQALFDERPRGLTAGLAALADDQRLHRLRMVREDDRSPLAEEDAEGWFAIQLQLMHALRGLLDDILAEIQRAATAAAAAEPMSESEWYDSW